MIPPAITRTGTRRAALNAGIPPLLALLVTPAQDSHSHFGGTAIQRELRYNGADQFAWYAPFLRWLTLVEHPLDLDAPLFGPHALDDHPRRFPMARRKRRPADTPGSTTNPDPPPTPSITATPNTLILGASLSIGCAGLIAGDQLDLGNGVIQEALATQTYTYPATGTWVLRIIRAGAAVDNVTWPAVVVQPQPETPKPPVGITVTPANPVAGQTVTVALSNLQGGELIDFGDTVVQAAQASQSHIWNAGSYPLRVLRGPESVASKLVVVQPAVTPAPTPSFDITPRNGNSTQVRTASATAYPPNTRVAWGDGTFTALQGSTALHTYPVGSYTASLVDQAGANLPGVATYTVTSTAPPPPPPPGPSLYVEPADPWGAYQWNDSVGASSTDAATLVIDQPLLDRYARIATDPEDGIAKWLIDFRDLPANIRNPRNMVTGKRAILVKAGNRWVWAVHGQAMGVGGGGTSRGIVGCVGDSKFTFGNFSFYGPDKHMTTGQWAGSVQPEFFKHAELRSVNLRRTKGFQAAHAHLGDTNQEGFVMTRVHGWRTNGQIRDTTTASGWKPGTQLHVDREVANLWQVASSTLRRYWVAYCISEQEPGDSYIEDTGNSYDVQLYGATGFVRVIYRVEVRGAYPMNLNSDYSGGGIIYDGSLPKWLSAEECYVLNASNYGFAHAGGSHTRFKDGVAYNRLAPGLVRPDSTPDTGHYDRDYYNSPDTSGRVTDGLRVGWFVPSPNDPTKRLDGPGNGTSARGTVFSNIQKYNGGTGPVPQSVIDAAMAEIQGKRDAANVLVGRLNP